MSGFQWKFLTLANERASYDRFSVEIQRIFREGFDTNGWSLPSIMNTLSRCDVLGLLAGDDEELCAYALYSFPRARLMGSWLLWEESICLKKKAQHQGYATQALSLARDRFPHRKLGWLGGRTQNPIILKRYSKLGTLFPFDSSYSGKEGREVMSFLLENVEDVYRVVNLNRENGLCHGVYGRRLGHHDWNENGRFEQDLLRWGFDVENGDAVIAVAKVAS